MSKRIPQQSAFNGISSRQWVSFCKRLTDPMVEEFVFHIFNEGTPVPLSTELSLELNKLHSIRKLIPAPRLVGIETNPGPVFVVGGKRVKKLPGKNSVNNRRRRRVARVSNNSVRGSRFGDLGMKRFRSAPSSSDYVRALKDPFFAPAPKLGVMTFAPTAKHGYWFEGGSMMSGAGSSTCFAIVLQPGVVGTVKFYTSILSSTILSAATTSSAQSMANSAALQALAQAGRTINLAVRAKARTAATSLPGIMGGLYIPHESLNTILTQSFDQLTQLAQYRSFSSSNSNIIGGEVQYRPMDPSDFDFYQGDIVGHSAATYANNLVILGVGWPAGAFNLEVAVMGHVETTGGIDLGGETDAEPDLVDGGLTMDSISAAIAAAGEPVVTSIDLLQAMTSADSNVARYRGARSIRGMISNFNDGFSGNSIVPSNHDYVSVSRQVTQSLGHPSLRV